jgi:drug/metabolite transporter (DMT)-like permease
MRFGVEALPPFMLASARYLIAAPLVFVLCAIFRLKMRPSRKELGTLAIIGILMLGIGNTSVIWAEQYIPSGFAALLVASIPLYAALIEVILPHNEGLATQGWIGIFVGFAGIIFLLWPGIRDGLHGDSQHIVTAGITLIGALCWTCASVISRRSTVRISGLAAAGWQMLFAGLFDSLLMLVTGGYRSANWGLKAWGSIAYLVVCGSLITYTAYLYLLDNVAVSKVATHAFVNPVIAVILGAAVLHERLSSIECVGMAGILIAVFLVTSSKMKSGKPTIVDEDLAMSQQA